MRILIVEDDDRIAKPVAEDLRHQNHVVEIAGDGLEGLEYARSTPYDLILLDVMLPGLDGLTHVGVCATSVFRDLFSSSPPATPKTIKLSVSTRARMITS
jgi:CheY-like chemotaxis protein